MSPLVSETIEFDESCNLFTIAFLEKEGIVLFAMISLKEIDDFFEFYYWTIRSE